MHGSGRRWDEAPRPTPSPGHWNVRPRRWWGGPLLPGGQATGPSGQEGAQRTLQGRRAVPRAANARLGRGAQESGLVSPYLNSGVVVLGVSPPRLGARVGGNHGAHACLARRPAQGSQAHRRVPLARVQVYLATLSVQHSASPSLRRADRQHTASAGLVLRRFIPPMLLSSATPKTAPVLCSRL